MGRVSFVKEAHEFHTSLTMSAFFSLIYTRIAFFCSSAKLHYRALSNFPAHYSDVFSQRMNSPSLPLRKPSTSEACVRYVSPNINILCFPYSATLLARRKLWLGASDLSNHQASQQDRLVKGDALTQECRLVTATWGNCKQQVDLWVHRRHRTAPD
jgi:hypothetical protein